MSRGPYAHIVCCVDRTDASRVVQRKGLDLARALGSDLRILHVIKPPLAFTGGVTTRSTPSAALEERLRGEATAWLLEQVEAEDNVQLALLEGSFAGEAICDWAGANPASLLIAGQSEKHHPRALGSTATYLSMHAPCDVLLVETHARE